MMLIVVILALASIIGVGYFIATLVFYLKKRRKRKPTGNHEVF